MSNELQMSPAMSPNANMARLETFTQSIETITLDQSASRLEDFAALIENVIVPRLLVNHSRGADLLAFDSRDLPRSTTSEFIDCTMSDDPDAAVAMVRSMLARGVSFEAILLDLLAPAARELGNRWVHDTTSFVEVTLGVARMHRILREFDGVPAHLWSTAGDRSHALLLPVPGEQHTFGLRLVQEFLLRESWTVTNHPVETVQGIKAVVSAQHFDVVGFSLSGETLIEELTTAISMARTFSRNRHIKVIVGGQLFAERRELFESCGADAHAADAPEAVRVMNRWAAAMAYAN
jgi:MerR family transcriptional regulator, light-induced transcriptional regulator